MWHPKSCWTPCFWHDNVRDGSLACAGYSAAVSLVSLCYTAYVMAGGDSSQLFLPFFETNQDTSLVGWGSFAVVYFVVFLVLSALLVVGVKREVRDFVQFTNVHSTNFLSSVVVISQPKVLN